MWFRDMRQKAKIPTGTDPRIRLGTGGFYLHEHSERESNQLFCLCPWDEDNDTEFPTLAQECAAWLLRPFPMVVNQVAGIILAEKIREAPFVQSYRQAGGQPIFAEERTLLTITNEMDRSLLEQISGDRGGLEDYEFDFYGFELPPPADRSVYAYALKVYYHENHDYLLFETAKPLEVYLEGLRKICEAHGKILMTESYSFMDILRDSNCSPLPKRDIH